MTLTHLGEQWLDKWLERNALICWRAHDKPWELEEEVIKTVSCPLNIRGNEHHAFCPTLRKIRADAISNARLMPVACEDNQARRPVKGVQ
jgi:hypothetical protein